MRWVLLVLGGCGRIAFDPLGDAGGGGVDVGPDAFALPGLVAYWPFEPGPAVGIVDVIGGHTGSCSGTTCPAADSGHRGMGLAFDGVDDCIVVPDSSVLHLPTITLSLWAKQSVTRNVSQISKLVGQPTVTMNTWQLESGGGAGQPNDPLDGLSFTTSAHGYLWAVPGTIHTGQWQHLAATYDGTTLILYVDGAQAQSATSGALTYDNGDVWIGCDNNGIPANDENYVGTLDEVQIYNRALSAAEIHMLASN
jgi:hypothetical protein